MTRGVLHELFDLSGRVALITGGSRGLGLQIAEALGEFGALVAITARKADELEAAAACLKAAGSPAMCFPVDLGRPEAPSTLCDAVLKAFGRIDILVNNAGVAGGGPVEAMSEDAWDRNLDINLKGTMLMCQAAIPAMKRQRSGRILNAASFAAIIPSIGGAAYAASKAGVESLTRVLASELGPWEITVNAYAPGMIPTQMNRFAEAPPERQEQLLDTLSLRRWGDAQDVANLICFLASDKAGYITGTLIDISGGKFATQMPWVAHRG